MQDQLTGNSSNLQQQKGDLQQNTPNLQQSGTPTSTYDTSGVLSEAAPTGSLRVHTSTSTNPSTIQPDAAVHGSNYAWVWLLVIPIVAVVVVMIVWPRKIEAPAEEPAEPTAPEPVAPVKVAPKPKKKSKNRKKKSGRR